MNTSQSHEPWNKGKLIGQKSPLRLKDIWAIRFHLQQDKRIRDLALFNLAIDSKLRGCDLVDLRVRDISPACDTRCRCRAYHGFFEKHGEVCMSIQAESFTPEQVVKLLPTQKEIRELMTRVGCKDDEVDPRLERAIHQLTAGIVTTPTNHELWRDLANAFGLRQEMRWKYLLIAHQLCPNDLGVLGDLAWTCDMLGDHQQALGIHNQRLALAETEEVQNQVLEDISWMQFNERAERAWPQLESFVSH